MAKVKHTFQSAIPDGQQPGMLQPSHWNADHTLDGVTETELGYLSGVTSGIQTQLNAKANSADVVPDTSTNSGYTATISNNNAYAGVTVTKDSTGATNALTVGPNGVTLSSDDGIVDGQYATITANQYYQLKLDSTVLIDVGAGFCPVRMITPTAPANAGATGLVGEVRITADYIYVCTAENTWKRVAVSTW